MEQYRLILHCGNHFLFLVILPQRCLKWKKDTEIEVNFLHHKQVIIIMKQKASSKTIWEYGDCLRWVVRLRCHNYYTRLQHLSIRKRYSALRLGWNPSVDAPKKSQILLSMAKLSVFMLPFLFNSHRFRLSYAIGCCNCTSSSTAWRLSWYSCSSCADLISESLTSNLHSVTQLRCQSWKERLYLLCG